jgi:undecaprenyl pyrophosphate phosphatase UppP
MVIWKRRLLGSRQERTLWRSLRLTKAEQLQASNLRPASAVEVHLVRCLALLCGCSSSGFDISLFIMCNMNMHYATLHLSLSGQVGCDVFVATGHC